MFLAVQESSKGDSSFDNNMYINNLHEHCLAFTKNMGVSLNKCIEGDIALKGNISIGSPHIGHGNIEHTHTHKCCRRWQWQWQWWWQQCLKGSHHDMEVTSHTKWRPNLEMCYMCMCAGCLVQSPRVTLILKQTTNYSLPASAMMFLLTLLVTEPLNNLLGFIFKFP